jgi:hypothetical protein
LRVEIAALSQGSNSPALENCAREGRASRSSFGRRATSDPNCSANQRDPAAGESSWATERMENALLRERINDIAAEVAKLAIQLEGPNSAIEAMLAAEPPRQNAPPSRPTTHGPPPRLEGGGTLAERIRALQSHASRARQQGA